MKKTMIAAALLLALTGARAEFLTGNDLLARLTGDGPAASLGLGYVMGVFDATHSEAHCPAHGVTAGQVRDIVLKTLGEFPDLRHYPADIITRVSLGKAFPCPKKKPQAAPAL